jgi:hypothetical protein
MQAVFWPEAEQHSLTAKQYYRELCLGILEAEVNVSRGRRPEVGDLAFHPHVKEFLLNGSTNLLHKFANGPDTACGAPLKNEVELAGR